VFITVSSCPKRTNPSQNGFTSWNAPVTSDTEIWSKSPLRTHYRECGDRRPLNGKINAGIRLSFPGFLSIVEERVETVFADSVRDSAERTNDFENEIKRAQRTRGRCPSRGRRNVRLPVQFGFDYVIVECAKQIENTHRKVPRRVHATE